MHLYQCFVGMQGGSGGVKFSLLTCENCLDVCFMGLVVGRNYVWCLVIVVIFMGFVQAGAKRCVGCLKVIIWGW